MAEFSMFPWETQTGTGDGATSYTQDQANDFFRYFDVQDPTVEGVAKGVMNELSISGGPGLGQITMNTGAAVCYGRYWNDTTVVVNCPFLPAIGLTAALLVLEADWATNTIRAKILMAADGVLVYPTVTQTAGTIWQIGLYQILVGIGGTIAPSNLVSVRQWRKFTGEITADEIEDRTRRYFVPVYTGYDLTAGVVARGQNPVPALVGDLEPGLGVYLNNANSTIVTTTTQAPADFVSAPPVSVYAIIVTGGGAAANPIAYSWGVYQGGNGLPYDNVILTGGVSYQNTNADKDYVEILLTAIAQFDANGDTLYLRFARIGGDAGDTYAGECYLAGFAIEYEADS